MGHPALVGFPSIAHGQDQHEGHGFSRAVGARLMRALAPEVRFPTVYCRAIFVDAVSAVLGSRKRDKVGL
jgi:hypothetical protein